mmetsp:Transcript_10408/g.32013  ORF Transcript_10408/g.32013 Transcript_10408/m.32013 type:complete len:299 (-) Transcript_10408:22-918(-)
MPFSCRAAHAAIASAAIASAYLAPRRQHRRAPLTRPRASGDSFDVDVGDARVHVYGGRLAFQWDVRYRKETAPVVDATALAVREAPGKGRGVFAAAPLAAGAFLGSYAGEVLDGDAFAARYGAGAVPDYVIRVDGDCFVDGRAAAEADDYSPSLLNHGENGNVVRYCATRRPPRVDFFVARDVSEGEELVFDYGERYWRGRDAPVVAAAAAPSTLDAALDKPFLDPDDERDEGPLKEWFKEKYRADPDAFKAAYVAVVVSGALAVGQAVVRWYKYDVFLPAQGDAQADSLVRALDAIS